MAAKATTFRIEPAVTEGLAKLAKILHRSRNQLANEAIREFVNERIRLVEAELESTLEDLRAYRQRDPEYRRAIADFVDAEVAAKHDPAEGTVVAGEVGTVDTPGPTETEVLKVLGR